MPRPVIDARLLPGLSRHLVNVRERAILPAQMPHTLSLVRGETILGTIDVNLGAADFPWFSGVFHATPEFEEVRHLFDRELQLLRANSSDDSAVWDEWETVHAELHDPGVRLCSIDTDYVVEDILIHINGTEAWWRGDEQDA